MRFNKLMMAAAAASMTAMPVVATAAAPASKLSVARSSSVPASVRASATKGESKAIGAGILILVLGIAAVAAGVVAATDGDSSPDSP